MKRLIIFLAPLAFAAPAAAQTHDAHAGHMMSGRPMSGEEMSDEATPAAKDPHAGHGAAEPADLGVARAADLPVGNAPAPPPPTDHAADAVYGAAAMDRARAVLAREHGGMPASKLMLDLAEVGRGPDGGGYRWDAQAWYGGDVDRAVVKSEGQGDMSAGLQAAEVQLLWSRAVGPYADLQAGVRADFEPRGRAYATLAVEALLPYWIEAEGAVFLSGHGDVSARVKAAWDLRLTQRLVLQPRAEVELAAQDVRRDAIGAGFTRADLGLRLRYELKREFAPYVGVSFERSLGRTAGLVRARGDRARSTTAVVGLRAWF